VRIKVCKEESEELGGVGWCGVRMGGEGEEIGDRGWGGGGCMRCIGGRETVSGGEDESEESNAEK